MSIYNPSVSTKSLYIHWPFCPYKCHFCPFVALASHDQYMGQYHQALIKEIDAFASRCPQRLELDTIYFGGGTPSTYPNDLLLDMSGKLRKVFSFDDKTEFTLEVNPGTVNPDQFKVWTDVGINRLSVGVQSLNDKVLISLNRQQTVDDVKWLMQEAPKLFSNISIDLILGLPEISFQQWQEYVAQVVQWPISHISIYFLTVHEDTPLYFKVKKNAVILPEDDAMVDTYLWTIEYLFQHGFDQYEVSNFARDGKYSKHNSVYWERKPYKAFGIGACSFDGEFRFQNQKNLTKYMQAMQKGEDITVFCEQLSKEQVFLERMMLGLRRSCGFDFSSLMVSFSDSVRCELSSYLKVLEDKQYVRVQDGRVTLTPQGLAVHNHITIKLDQILKN